MKIWQMFEENEKLSNVRVQSFCTLFYDFYYITACLHKGVDINVELVIALLLGAFAPKVVQKFAEKKM